MATARAISTFDGGRAARVTFEATPADLLAEDAGELVARAEAEAQVAYAHESVGAMETALSMTTEYLRTRKQFGVPSRPSRRSPSARRTCTSRSSWPERHALGHPRAPRRGDAVDAASRAKLQVSKAGRHIGKEAIQLHGGIGVTMEYAVGHYTMRLTAIDHLLGDGRHHLSRLAGKLGDYGVIEALP